MKNKKEMTVDEILNQIEQAESNLDTTITITLTKEQSKIHTDSSIYGIIKGLEGMVGFLKQTLVESGVDKNYCNSFIKVLVEMELNNKHEYDQLTELK